MRGKAGSDSSGSCSTSVRWTLTYKQEVGFLSSEHVCLYCESEGTLNTLRIRPDDTSWDDKYEYYE